MGYWAVLVAAGLQPITGFSRFLCEAVSNAASHVLEPGTSASETFLRNFLHQIKCLDNLQQPAVLGVFLLPTPLSI